MEITLEEAFTARPRDPRPDLRHLRGLLRLRRQAGTKPKTCPTCGGHGRVRAQQGFFTIERTCPTCQGRGQVIDDPCPSCGGAGPRDARAHAVGQHPAGVEDGTRIRLAGEGEAGLRGGPPGDLYIFLSIKPHAFFQRDGADLFCRVPISMTTAALGGEFEVPTIDGGRAKVKVPSRHPDRQAVPPQGQGHAGAALRATSATCTSRSWSRRRRT
jgi:molecular chaperone DnaJ